MDAPREAGPYRILDTLGRGGMGVVYLAAREGTGERVALKMVPAPREGLLASIRREIDGLASLCHPGIVRVRDHGVAHGLPWYAMDLVQGRTLRDVIDEAFSSTGGMEELPDGGSLPAQGASAWARRAAAMARPKAGGGVLTGMLALARGLCSSLAYLHGEGVVHRDLKPANVLVTGTGEPVLVDFGLMGRFAAGLSREALEASGDVVGTRGYMAPEQEQGELVDARADMFAFGRLLQEMVTGRVASDPGRTAPLPPSELVDGVPPEVEDLIARLLQPDPRHRLGDAAEADAVLEKLGAPDPFHGTAPRGRPYLFRPALAGRDSLLRRLEGHLGDPGVTLILVGGESGVGKTRFVMALAALAGDSGTPVLAGSPASSHPRALHLLKAPLESVADRCRAGGPEATARILGADAGILGLYEPALADLPGAEPSREPPSQDVEGWRSRVAASLTGTFGRLAAEMGRGLPGREAGALVLVLDDLQAADEMTLSWLRTLGDRDAALPFVVIGTHRTDADDAVAAIQGPGVVHVALGGLDVASVSGIVADMLGTDRIPERLPDLLYGHSKGSPFFVGEYLRMALAEGLLTRDASRGWQLARGSAEVLPVPGSIEDLVSRRLAGLPRQAAPVLAAAAVAGPAVDLSFLAALAGVPEGDLWSGIRDLMARHVLEEPRPGHLRFVHDQLRDAALASLAPRARRRLHRIAAGRLESAGGVADELLAEAGRHWEGAGAPARARGYYARAAQLATRRVALQEAEVLYRAALALVRRPSAETVQTRLQLGWAVLQHQGRYREARDVYVTARRDARSCGDRAGHASALRHLASAHNALGEMAAARRLYRQALAEARALGIPRLEGGILTGLAVHEADRGRPREAMKLHLRGLALARAEGDRDWEAKELINIAAGHHEMGETERARAGNEAVLAMVREGAAPELETYALANLGALEAQDGRPAQALPIYERALAVARALGNGRIEASLLHAMGSLHHVLGHLPVARASWNEALELHRRSGNRRAEGVVLDSLGTLAAGRGDDAEALRCFGAAVALARDTRARDSELAALAHLGNHHLEWGRIDEARALMERALAGREKAGDRREQGRSLLDVGNLALHDGDLERARQCHARGLELLRHAGESLYEGPALHAMARVLLAEGRIREARSALRQAMEHHRAVGTRRLEAMELGWLAMVEGLLDPGAVGALETCKEAERLIQTCGDEIDLARTRCFRAHLELAAGEERWDLLDEARDARDRLGVTPESDLARRVACLERALQARARGRKLVCGYVPEDLPGPQPR